MLQNIELVFKFDIFELSTYFYLFIMTVKVTMTFFLDEDNDTQISQTLNEFYEGNKKEMFASDNYDGFADDHMEEIVRLHLRPYGYKYTCNHNFKYKIIDKPFEEIKQDCFYE